MGAAFATGFECGFDVFEVAPLLSFGGAAFIGGAAFTAGLTRAATVEAGLGAFEITFEITFADVFPFTFAGDFAVGFAFAFSLPEDIGW